MKKVLILVLSSVGDAIYDNCREKQKSTWDSITVEGVETLYYYGNLDIEAPTIIGRDLILKTGDNLENVTNKMKKALEFVYNMEWDYIFKTNASTYVDKKRLLNLSQILPDTECYSGINGIHGNWKFVSGAGTFLSRDVVKMLIDNFTDYHNNLVDDLATCDVLQKLGVPADSRFAHRVDYNHDMKFEDIINSINFTDISPYQYRCKSLDGDRNKDLVAFDNIFKYLNVGRELL